MSRRNQIMAMLPDLVFVETARKRAKLSPEDAAERMKHAIDWHSIDQAGNNLDLIMATLREAAQRALK